MATSEILENLEELESIRAYDAAKASEDEAVPFEQALQEIRSLHGKKGRVRTKRTQGT